MLMLNRLTSLFFSPSPSMCRVECNLKISEMNYLHNRFFLLSFIPLTTRNAAECRCENDERERKGNEASETSHWMLMSWLNENCRFSSLLSDLLWSLCHVRGGLIYGSVNTFFSRIAACGMCISPAYVASECFTVLKAFEVMIYCSRMVVS